MNGKFCFEALLFCILVTTTTTTAAFISLREEKMSIRQKIRRLNDWQYGGCKWTLRSLSQRAPLLTKNTNELMKILVDDMEI